jgi:exopolysaccharide production protein ExoZ
VRCYVCLNRGKNINKSVSIIYNSTGLRLINKSVLSHALYWLIITKMANALSQRKKFYLIQMLRGLACMFVVLMHTTYHFSKAFNQDFLLSIFKFGAAGVDIFFVISGFIIAYTNLNYLNDPREIGGFVKKRIIRIYPIYWILIILFLTLQLLLPHFYKNPFVFTPASTLSTCLLLPGHIMINGVSWTLTNELFFYFLFLVAFLLPKKKHLIYILSAYFIFLLVAWEAGAVTTNEYLNLFISPMNIEFFLGVFVVVLINKFPKAWIIPILITGVAWFTLSAIMSDRNISISQENYNRVWLFGMPSFLIILSLVGYELHFKTNVPKVLITLGDASYSIYLFHLPVVVAGYGILGKLHTRQHALLTVFIFLLVIAVTYLGVIIHQKIEKPLIKKLNGAFVK